MSCCGTEKSDCCASKDSQEIQVIPRLRRPLEVEFLFLDRTVCERCKGTEEVLKQAVEEAQRILGPTGVDVSLKMTHVKSEKQAVELGFVTSPTVRIMGRDAAFDVKENPCTSCSNLCGADVACRVWTWQQAEYSVPPKVMLLDAILRDAYLHPGEKAAPTPLKDLPDSLKRFFRGPREAPSLRAPGSQPPGGIES